MNVIMLIIATSRTIPLPQDSPKTPYPAGIHPQDGPKNTLTLRAFTRRIASKSLILRAGRMATFIIHGGMPQNALCGMRM